MHNPTECSSVHWEDGNRSAGLVSRGVCHLQGGRLLLPFLRAPWEPGAP